MIKSNISEYLIRIIAFLVTQELVTPNSDFETRDRFYPDTEHLFGRYGLSAHGGYGSGEV